MQWLERHVPKLVLAPSFIAALLFVYGFIGWTAWVSFTRSRLLPNYDLVGPIQYERLFASPRWEVALNNLFVFGVLFIGISMLLGLLLAIFLDQKIRSRRRVAHRLPVPDGAVADRDRHGVEMDAEPRPWAGIDGARLGVRGIHLRLDHRIPTWPSTPWSSRASGRRRAS